jgi:outer membrane protein OmpA-like peptidoglycan-associated protein
MKRVGLAVWLAGVGLAGAAWAQAPAASSQPQPAQKGQVVNVNVGSEPTNTDMYCSGFFTTEKVPDNSFVVAGWNSPDQTRFGAVPDYIYIHGRDIKEGDRLQIIRRVKDPNRYESYVGQRGAIRDAGTPYFELGYVKVIDVQKDTAVAVPVLTCAEFVPGDIAIPFVERPAPRFRVITLDRFAPPSGKIMGRIVMAKEFDTVLGTKNAVYLSVGEDKGVKVGDYFRATRTYSYAYRDPHMGLSTKATTYEETQANPQKLGGDVSSLPRKTLGDMIVLQVHRRTSTAMILTAYEDIHVGDGVELMDVSGAPEVGPIRSGFSNPPATPDLTMTNEASAGNAPKITCSASPTSVRTGESSTITCDASSPDNRPVNLTFVTNGGRLSTNKNQATLDTTDTGPGPIAVRATAFDDRQLSATAVTTVNVEAPPSAHPTAQKQSDLDFKPNSAYVNNRSKAILDDVALKLQQDPNSTAVLAGAADEKEPARLGTQRAENAKTYLTKSKGIDPQRLKTSSSSLHDRKVEIWTVPQGATPPQ